MGLGSSFALIGILLVLAGLLPLTADAASPEPPGFRAGLCNSPTRPLTPKQLRIMLEGLRVKTGLVEMRFDEVGFLTLGDRTHLAGGSATARALIIAAVDGLDSFRLENHNQSPAVAFAQIEATEDYIDAADVKHETWHVRLDFHDFAQVRGGAEARAAFDPTLNLLHELGHGVLKLCDTTSHADPLGECERHINKIRRELGLAERQNYTPQSRLDITPDRMARYFLAELTFVRAEAGPHTKKSTLYFNPESIAIASQVRPKFVCQPLTQVAMR